VFTDPPRAIVKARKSERRNFEGALRAFKEYVTANGSLLAQREQGLTRQDQSA
jgi:hypothetical protein